MVFDSTSVLAFVRDVFAVTEALSEIADEGGVVAVPVACVAEAAPSAVDGEALRDLASHPHIEILDAEAADWPGLGGMCALVEGFATASAAMVALDAGCWVLTAAPDRYAGVAAGKLVIELVEDPPAEEG